MNAPNLDRLPGLVTDDEGPVFNEPWEAQAFALVVGLHEKGVFEWNEWAETLGETIHKNEGNGTYYELWLEALEVLVSKKSITNEFEIETRSDEWKRALAATPHGMPVELGNERK